MAFTRQAQAPGRMDLRPVASAVALPPLKSGRLLDQLRERIRLLHYSLRTEEAYVYWARAFIRFHGLRHPAEMGKAEVEGFLMHLAAQKGLSASTHRQALSALIFLYDKVLDRQLRVKDVDFTHRALMVREEGWQGSRGDTARPVKALTADLRDRQFLADSGHSTRSPLKSGARNPPSTAHGR